MSNQDHALTSHLPKKYLIPIRAHSEEAFFDIAKQHKHLIENNLIALHELLPHSATDSPLNKTFRCIIQAHSHDDYSEKLSNLLIGKRHREIHYNTNSRIEEPRIAFIYSGMGPQWVGMGRELYHHYDTFKRVIDECDQIVQKHQGWSLLTEMFYPEESSRMDETWLAQPANFALQAGLTELWRHWGVIPDAVLGHSIGETTAFYVSGIHSLEESLLINLSRGRLQHQLRGQGNMLAVGVGEKEIQKYLTHHKHIKIAAINSNNSITLAGDSYSLDQLFQSIPNDIFKKYLNVNIPYHGHCMLEIKSDLEEELAYLKYMNGNNIQLFTTTTGEKWEAKFSPQHFWWENTSGTVYFQKAIENLLNAGYNTFIEVGPHKVLTPSIREIADEMNISCHILNSISRNGSELDNFQKNICSAFCSGVEINWHNYKISHPTLHHSPILTP